MKISELAQQTNNSLRLIMGRHPLKKTQTIVVIGSGGKCATASYINEILKEANFKTALVTTSGAEICGNKIAVKNNYYNFFQRCLNKIKGSEADYAVVEATEDILAKRLLDGIRLEATVVAGDLPSYSGNLSIFKNIQTRFAVISRDDQQFEEIDNLVADEQKMTYGKHPEAEARIARIKLYRKGTEADMVLDHQTHLELATNLLGEYNVMNMAAATTLAYLLGVRLHDIQEGVANLEAIPGRFERVVDGLDFDVVVDETPSPEALERTLSAAKNIAKSRVILVLSACGNRDQIGLAKMGEIAAKYADRIFLTDEQAIHDGPAGIRKTIGDGIKQAQGDAKTTEISERRTAIDRAIKSAVRGDMVLLTSIKYHSEPDSDSEIIKELTKSPQAAAAPEKPEIKKIQ